MKIKCVNVISDFKDAFVKGETYEASELKGGYCDVYGSRTKKDGTPWLGVQSLGHIVVLGVAKFTILSEKE